MRHVHPYVIVSRLIFTIAFFLCFTLVSIAQKQVSGTVRSSSGPVAGATVVVKNSNVATQTDLNGSFTIRVPEGRSILVISFVGLETREIDISNESNVDVTLGDVVSSMNEVVVTGYSTQRKKDIIGAVSVVNTKDLQTTPSSNLAAQLQGRAAGVVVSSAGEPGQAAVVRIRGFASAGNNDPLYIVDGVPTTDPSKINPNDIESLQVLKDASSASIYGSRASNGVVIITTRQGRSGRMSVQYDAYVGTQVITNNMMPEMLNTSQYLEYLQKSTSSTYVHPVFGQNGSFTIPEYIVVSPTFKGGVSGSDPRANPDLYNISNYSSIYQILRTSPGTNWFDEITRNAPMTSHQISISGGADRAVYSVGFNYFNQQGTFEETNFKRYLVRANSSFKVKEFLRFGENLQLSYEDRLGGRNRGEGDAWAMAYRMVPYIPVYDIKGGWGGNAVGESGNASNPVAGLTRQMNNTNRFFKIFGNVYAEILPVSSLVLRTSFGTDGGSQYEKIFVARTYERSENVSTAQLTEQSWYYLNWVWTNTATFTKTFAVDHDVKLLAGTEAIKESSRGVRGFREGFDFETPDFVSLNTGNSTVLGNILNFNTGRRTLYSYFGRLDYGFKGKYLLNATFRRDGSSIFGIENRYANFPSIGVAWRISEEDFMQDVSWLNDLKLRAGWGEMGSQSNVPVFNQFYTFTSNPSTTYYDINGNNTSAAQGYRANQEGNPKTKWETMETTNIGLDATILNNRLDFTLDVYRKDTRDLLVPQLRNGLEPLINKPFINLGTMRNTGFDLGINYKGPSSQNFNYNVGLTFAHYKNTMVKLNNEGTPRIVGLERLSNALRTEAGKPLSSFHGFVIDGFFNSQAEITNGAAQAGAVVGSWRYKDLNNDKVINDLDRTYLGDPHPDFQLGLNLNATYKNFDFTAFFFWNQGNEIYNYAKYYTDMRVFVGGVSTRVLNESWTPDRGNSATLPLLAPGAANGFTSFTTSTSNSYYIEDGSYFRAKTVMLGYSLPKNLMSRIGLSGARLYIQAQNLFTITNYTGPDPDLSIISRDPFGLGDYYIGVDLAGFPNPKQYLFGLNVTF